MGVLGGGVVAAAAPGEAHEEHAQHAGEDEEDVEVAQIAGVEGVEEAHAVGARRNGGKQVVPPGKAAEEEGDDGEVDRVAEDALDAVGDHDGDLAAGAGDGAGEGERGEHQRREGGPLGAEESEGDGQTEEVHQEARADGRENAVVEDAVEGLDEGRRDAEGAAVAHLEELAHRHRAGLAESVVGEADESEDHADGGEDGAPEAIGEAAVVVGLQVADEGDEAHAGFRRGDAEDVAVGDAAGGEEVGDAVDVLLRLDGGGDDDDDGNGEENPVDPVHGGGGVEGCSGD